MPRISFGPFSLDVRENWTLSTVILVGPPEEKTRNDDERAGDDSRPFQRNLVATMERVEPEETPESYVERQLVGFWKVGVEQYLGEEKTVQLGSELEGVMNEWVMVGPGGEWVRQMQLVCIKEGIAYTLIVSALDGEHFQAARQEFEEMLLSFR